MPSPLASGPSLSLDDKLSIGHSVSFVDDRAAILSLESAIGDSHRGLPENIFLFVSRITPIVNVDLLIQDKVGRTLLTWRDDRFYGCGWHVPGGIIRYKEKAADRIRVCAREEVGAELSFEQTPFLVSETISDQNSRGHFISLLYRCTLLSPLDEERRGRTEPPEVGKWRWHDRCPPNLLSVQSHYAGLLQP
jgi:colanic acid biosynthesis protein WcaH